jgi:feruloyl esterase
VLAATGKDIKFELWLPDRWNGKYAQAGNGGLAGAINYPTMGGALAEGYATASTDLGHQSRNFFDSSWMVGQKPRIIDFAYRAHHLVGGSARKIIAAYYGRRPRHAYFVGCSSGGWQALTEAQKFPDDFDGVVAGAPSNNFVKLELRSTIEAQMSLRHPEGNLTSAQTKLVAAAALRQCDAEDGIADGLMSDPMHCNFEPKQLLCKRGDKPPACLTQAQVDRVAALYGPMKSSGGLDLYPGPTFAAALAPSRPAAADSAAFSPTLRNTLTAFGYAKQPTVADFDADREIPSLAALLGPAMSAMNPDISKFEARGGKLLVWQGWADPAISPFNTIHYYEQVKAKTGANMDDFFRIFFVPGMGHCGGGSTGPNKFDMLAALDTWVEKNIAPDRIKATQAVGGRIARTRPLCVFPKVARYKGHGNVDDAQSFACVKP